MSGDVARPVVLSGVSLHPNARAELDQVAHVLPIPADPGELTFLLNTCVGIVCYSPPFDAQALEGAERLRVISCHACPPELRAAAEARGIHVHSVDSLWDTVADLTIGLMFATARKIAQADAAIRQGRWVHEDLKIPFSGHDIFGRSLGIVGLGRIGKIMVRRLRGFDLKVTYNDIQRQPELEDELGLVFQPLDRLLADSDIVVILLPLNDLTGGLIGAELLRSMRRDSILINTSRGAVLDEGALVAMLKEGALAGAGLDVFSTEPLAPGNPLIALDNVVLTPHLGGSTQECDQDMVSAVVRALADGLFAPGERREENRRLQP
jgi:phosphoglycerate dehydrogenase-like enzyme